MMQACFAVALAIVPHAGQHELLPAFNVSLLQHPADFACKIAKTVSSPASICMAPMSECGEMAARAGSGWRKGGETLWWEGGNNGWGETRQDVKWGFSIPFNVPKAGLYNFRCNVKLGGHDNTENNDFWLKVRRTTSRSKQIGKSFQDVWHKIYSNGRGWGWDGKYKDHRGYRVQLQLEQGDNAIFIAPRSKRYYLQACVLYQGDRMPSCSKNTPGTRYSEGGGSSDGSDGEAARDTSSGDGTTCHVVYDDGDQEEGVPSGRIDGKAVVGSKVQVDWMGKGHKYPATVCSCSNADAGDGAGSCNVHYSDGDFECAVPARRICGFIKMKGVANAKTMVDWGGAGRYFEGTLKECSSANNQPSTAGKPSCDVAYDDNDFEAGVAAANICGGASAGESTYVNWKGLGGWYKATICGCGDGGGGNEEQDKWCHVDYDDGDKEREVPVSRICGTAEPGARVRVNWEGKGGYFPGTLSACGRGGGGGGSGGANGGDSGSAPGGGGSGGGSGDRGGGSSTGGAPEVWHAMMKFTNEMRAKHCAPPLTWDAQLASESLAWASRLRMGHASGTPYQFGENMAYSQGAKMCNGKICSWFHTPYKAAKAWYDEVRVYRYGTRCQAGGGPRATCHFTLMVWTTVTKIGCGWKHNPRKRSFPDNMIVCRYLPAKGNIGNAGGFRDHVKNPRSCGNGRTANETELIALHGGDQADADDPRHEDRWGWEGSQGDTSLASLSQLLAQNFSQSTASAERGRWGLGG